MLTQHETPRASCEARDASECSVVLRERAVLRDFACNRARGIHVAKRVVLEGFARAKVKYAASAGNEGDAVGLIPTLYQMPEARVQRGQRIADASTHDRLEQQAARIQTE